MGIAENVEEIRGRLEDAAASRGGRGEDVTLIAVTKFADVQQIAHVMACGIRDLGENRAQVLLGKCNDVDKSAQWNFIGHLQTNKVKSIIPVVQLIHSVDRPSVAQEIQRCMAKANRVMPVLVQVNIAQEQSKAGMAEREVLPFLQQLQELPNLSVKGLMAMMPLEQPEELRPYFIRMRDLFYRLQDAGFEDQMRFLSMGMSNDYEIAVQEGANMVRIGSAIFK
ncbi:MAG: YggS family pyridoxal phosphate-dependent enzyme [Christensenellales bacterium]|jgi:pyridoxal phosphate enzyme (YggS family)